MKKPFLYLLILLNLSCQTQPSLKIATSANMQFAMAEIVSEFEKENNINVDLIVSSSGKLTAQIEQGAPFDVFVSANMGYPQYLYEHDLTLNPPNNYAYGQLVLWTLNDFKPSLNILKSDQIHKIAIPNPKTAPYGEASIDVLKKHGIYNQVKSKLIYGESVSQCNQFITTQSADIGFTAMSIVLSDQMKHTGQWIKINPNDYKPIEQGVVILKNSTQTKNAQLFYDFLYSVKSQSILTKNGYLVEKFN